MLISEGLMGEEEAEQIEEEARQTIVEAVEFAQASPEPAVDTMLEGVYA
jgi:TPP-dependent pyruvate/acetoin dehydrogenase alpha subunit